MYKLIIKYKVALLALIIVVGLILRFYRLGENPISLNWDEVSTGYNAYSILKTGRDEYGNFLPISIRSFDDYKPPLYTYLDVPFIAVFGMNEAAVRLPSAILGTLSIILIYFLILELFPKNKKESLNFDISKSREVVALIGAFMFAISPWSLQFSRAAYEGNIGLFFLLSGFLFFLKSFKKSWYLLLSSVFLVLSMYSYHSFRLVVPLFLVIMFVCFLRQLLAVKKTVGLAIVIFAVLVFPIFYSLVATSSGTGSRLSMVTLFGPSPNFDHSITQLEYDKKNNDLIGEVLHNRRIVYFLAIAKGYLDHYNPDFLFLHGDGGRQHHAVDMGMLYLFDLPLILIGFLVLCRNISRRTLLLFGFILIVPIPSAITTGTPHPVRAIAMLPGFIIFSSIGAVFLLEKVSSIKHQVSSIRLKYFMFAIFFLLFSVNVIYYLHQYYVHTPIEYGEAWQYGYKQAVQKAYRDEKKYDKIVITNKYDQPYIFFLFYNKIDPSWYQKNWNFTSTGVMPRFERKIGKYDFRNINWGEDQKLKKALIISSPDEVPKSSYYRDSIYFLNGQEALRISET